MLFWKKKPEAWLIVGLGNPGETYARNRHNIGFMCLRHIARSCGIRLDRKQGQARIGSGEIAGQNAILARPQTFMNRSGEAVGRLVEKYRIMPDRLIVIHDDLDLPPGKTRVRRGGSSGGHKGIISIIDAVGSTDFVRMKVGIGRPESAENNEADVIDYVLGDLTPEEEETLSEVMPRVSDAIHCLLTEGLETTMSRFN